MNILHVVVTLDPSWGGPPMIASRLAAAQAGLGHDVTLACMDSPGREAEVANALRAVPRMESVRIIRIPHQPIFDAVVGFGMRRALTPLVARSDVVHLHSVWDSVLRVTGSLAREFRKPYFILLNGMLDPWSLSQRKWKKRIALALSYRRHLNGASGLHLGNLDERTLIKPLGLRPRTHVIPNGVFVEEISPLPATGEFYSNHPELQARPYILFLSRLHFKKGLDFLARAFAIVARERSDIVLVVAGPDDGELERFQRSVSELEISDRVFIVGPQYGRDKLSALVDAQCFCLPSRQEGFSVAITEALGCGVPVVISEGCHFPEVATIGAGFVTPLDDAAIAAALSRMLADPAARTQMGLAGLRYAHSHLTWPRIAEQTIEMYEQHRK